MRARYSIRIDCTLMLSQLNIKYPLSLFLIYLNYCQPRALYLSSSKLYVLNSDSSLDATEMSHL